MLQSAFLPTTWLVYTIKDSPFLLRLIFRGNLETFSRGILFQEKQFREKFRRHHFLNEFWENPWSNSERNPWRSLGGDSERNHDKDIEWNNGKNLAVNLDGGNLDWNPKNNSEGIAE